MKEPRVQTTPFNRLTHICEDVSRFIEAHPDHLESDRAIVILEDEHDAGEVGTMLLNHTDGAGVITTLLQVLGNILKTMGKKMQVQLGEDGEVMDL